MLTKTQSNFLDAVIKDEGMRQELEAMKDIQDAYDYVVLKGFLFEREEFRAFVSIIKKAIHSLVKKESAVLVDGENVFDMEYAISDYLNATPNDSELSEKNLLNFDHGMMFSPSNVEYTLPYYEEIAKILKKSGLPKAEWEKFN